MKGGDKLQCWPWLGSLSPNPIFCWNKKRLQAHRVVFALRKKMRYEDVPQLTWACGNNTCCNPWHIVERYGIEERTIGFASSKARGLVIRNVIQESNDEGFICKEITEAC